MLRQAYDTDLTDAEWELFEKTLLDIRPSTKGRKPVTARREMVNAILIPTADRLSVEELAPRFPSLGPGLPDLSPMDRVRLLGTDS